MRPKRLPQKYKDVLVNGKKYTIRYSWRKNNKYVVDVNGTWVHFAAKGYRMFPGMKRGEDYCTRSFGIRDKSGKRTAKDIYSPNFWSRVLWECQGNKSVRY